MYKALEVEFIISRQNAYYDKRWQQNEHETWQCENYKDNFRFTWCNCWFKEGCSLFVIILPFSYYITGQKKPNRERCAECVLKAFCFAFPKRSPSVPLAFPKCSSLKWNARERVQLIIFRNAFLLTLLCTVWSAQNDIRVGRKDGQTLALCEITDCKFTSTQKESFPDSQWN